MFAATASRARPTPSRRRYRAVPGRDAAIGDFALTPLTNEPAWQRHAKFFESRVRAVGARSFRNPNLDGANPGAPRPTMFYMFSGPTPLCGTRFTRSCDLLLSALEPVGKVPDLTKCRAGSIGSNLYDIEQSLGSILSFSFFITKEWKTDLQAGPIQRHLARCMSSWRARERPSATSA